MDLRVNSFIFIWLIIQKINYHLFDLLFKQMNCHLFD
jgi:hypothetical protein